MNSKYFLLLVLMTASLSAFSQKEKKTELTDPDSTGVMPDNLLPTTAPLLLFDDYSKSEKKKEEKKKTKKNIHYGEKTKKGYTKQTVRDQTQYQIFNFTTQNREFDPYIRDIHWFDTRDKVIRSKEFDPSRGYLLHGPYTREVGDVVVEKGNFFFGTKHGTWLTFDTKTVLLDKLHYSEGWPKDSKVTYYNREQRKIEKLTPVEYDLMEGNFYHFHENGQIAVTGEYHFGEKIGRWTEYWNTKNNKIIRKREIQYQENPFTKNFTPFIRAEWDQDGNLIYRKEGIASN
jgi:antitoxin component YwqK of YwqJK toxin-antitoxin module